jgi:hypothetical protein
VLPLAITLCRTDPATSVCLEPPTPSSPGIVSPMAADETQTFGVFLNASGDVPFDPANARVFVRFVDSDGVVRGATSVAVTTDS